MTEPVHGHEGGTAALIAWCRDTLDGAPTAFDAARQIARRLGAHSGRGGLCDVIFWTPELIERRVPEGDVFLEVLDPVDPLDLRVSRQRIAFRRTLVPMARCEAYSMASVAGMRPGSRAETGSFYALAWRDGDGRLHRVLDPLAASLPFGPFAPAEYYDLATMQAGRADLAYYAAMADTADGGVVEVPPPVNILQIHVPTATAGGTLASLARQFDHLADRVRRGLEPEPADRIYLAYDAIQLLPVEPTTVYERGPEFWTDDDGADDPDAATLTVDLRRPDTTNWGYDVVIAGMATVNPALLETGRPDELLDLAVALHNFPRPKRLILDVVFGHADNQALRALNHSYFAGPNMYGQNLAYRNPVVRAILLEMQRRKVDFGADGVRVDGAQDFKFWDVDAEEMRHDDDYLELMAATPQSVCGVAYRPWFIFEDGRPWPQEDWELSSTYRAVIERQPEAFQWGPLTFAHNTPFLYGFWLSKWWRIREILERGESWISGCANHDTLRRGTQISPKRAINTRLGDTRMEIINRAYDHPSAQLLTYAALPGVPMDFLNASARASWGFIRNQDDAWGVKVVAEEAISLDWQVDDYAYSMPMNFRRLKEMGFETREELARFMKFLPALVEVTDYDLDVICLLLNRVEPPLAGPHPFDVPALKRIARAWMDDMHDYCNVASYLERLSDGQTRFTFALRQFRRERPWLRGNFGPRDRFEYRQPVDGAVLFTSLRHGPAAGGGTEQVFMVAHLEGGPVSDITPLELPVDGIAGGGWQVALRTPPIGGDYIAGPLTLHDGMGVLFTRVID